MLKRDELIDPASCMSRARDDETLHVFCVDDGGEWWWYVADSAGDARSQHVKLNYTEVGVILDESNELSATQLQDDEPLTVDDVVRLAELWVALEGRGLLASTIH